MKGLTVGQRKRDTARWYDGFWGRTHPEKKVEEEANHEVAIKETVCALRHLRRHRHGCGFRRLFSLCLVGVSGVAAG